MTNSLFELLTEASQRFTDNPAIYYQNESLNYQQFMQKTVQCALQLQAIGIKRFDRVAIFLPKQFETVISIFASSALGAIFVPINPLLKPEQVVHILQDCNVKLLITNAERYQGLLAVLQHSKDVTDVLLVNALPDNINAPTHRIHLWQQHTKKPLAKWCFANSKAQTDADVAAILYTSGSTGKAKGVVLSHRNMLVGAASVASYLGNTAEDVLLAILPLSFDYGLSQITTAVSVGASVVLLDFFLVQDVVKAVQQHKVTGIAAVPPLWAQLAKAKWPQGSSDSVRYLTNSGGAMPLPLLKELQQIFNQAAPYLMYGLTEAFRSTYLPPAELCKRPGSMGKAIPNAEIVVVREDGSFCGPNEPGELVHRGPLVSLGYWNAPEKTAERFKYDPLAPKGLQLPQTAVWSGDTVRYDEEGFLYFIGRRDEMIKTSGYRVSPTEVEEAIYQLSPMLQDVAAIGIPHAELGQAILVLFACKDGHAPDVASWVNQLKQSLPTFMQPKALIGLPVLPKNANGKIDRKLLSDQYQTYLDETLT